MNLPIVIIDKNNIDKEHLCCAVNSKNNLNGANQKKKWMKDRIEEGLVFLKINESAKIFVEYMPAEYGWRGITAPNCMLIHCLWISGRFQGQGLGKKMLNKCIQDAQDKGKDGVSVVSSTKKMPFLTDKSFFIKNGFKKTDEAYPYFELLSYKINTQASIPKFIKNDGLLKDFKGFLLVYSDQCPYMDFWIQEYVKIANSLNIKISTIKIENRKQIEEYGLIFPTFSIFKDGIFLTHRPMVKSQFEKFLIENIK